MNTPIGNLLRHRFLKRVPLRWRLALLASPFLLVAVGTVLGVLFLGGKPDRQGASPWTASKSFVPETGL